MMVEVEPTKVLEVIKILVSPVNLNQGKMLKLLIHSDILES